MELRDVARVFDVNCMWVRSSLTDLVLIIEQCHPLSQFTQQILSHIDRMHYRVGEHSYKSPSLEVWVSLNIMRGGGVLIAAR